MLAAIFYLNKWTPKKMGLRILISVTRTLLNSCVSKDDRQANIEGQGKKYFDYDNIDYYFNNFDGRGIGDLYEGQPESVADSIKAGIILGEIPNDSTDLSFIDKTRSNWIRKKVSRQIEIQKYR